MNDKKMDENSKNIVVVPLIIAVIFAFLTIILSSKLILSPEANASNFTLFTICLTVFYFFASLCVSYQIAIKTNEKLAKIERNIKIKEELEISSEVLDALELSANKTGRNLNEEINYAVRYYLAATDKFGDVSVENPCPKYVDEKTLDQVIEEKIKKEFNRRTI